MKGQIISSPEIEARLGTVQRITLDPVNGYRERFVNADKSAYMTVDVVGVKGRAAIKVSAKKTNGNWKILDASIDGQSVKLSN